MLRGYMRSQRSFHLGERTSRMDVADRVCRDNLRYIRDFIPSLTSSLRKGECGRICVVGGTAEYTGAPYYSAISALKVGADVAYIICAKEAAAPIKSYSPAVIVYPYLDHSEVIYKTSPCLDRVHCLVIGPGLGRDQDILRNVQAMINYCNHQMSWPIPLIFDADGLFLVTENLQLIKDYKGLVVLTPNAYEYTRLCEKLGMKEQQFIDISRSLNCVLLKKGEVDTISNGFYQKILKLPSEYTTAVNSITGSRRRCAGQGDILAGCLATFLTWYIIRKRKEFNNGWNQVFTLAPASEVDGWDLEKKKKAYDEKFRGFTAACFAGSLITRQSSFITFTKVGRSMTASEIVHHIPNAFAQFFA